MKPIFLWIAGAVVVVSVTGAILIFKAPPGGSPTVNKNQDLSKNIENTQNTETTENAEPETADNITADADGFGRMPGEPSRGGGSYVITGDTCEQFTVKFVENLTGKKILRTEAPGDASACQYYISEQNKNLMFQINVSFLSVENQKKAFESFEWKVAKEPRIPMDNFVVYQEDNLINKIYLILGPEKFVGIDRSAADALTENEIMDLAIKIGDKIKNFK